jgi:hypothetical protein
MIKENEILALLGSEIPGLRAELEKIDDIKSPYKMVRCLSDFTFVSIEKKKYPVCKKCLKLAEKFLLDGDRSVRNAIENVFLSTLAKSFAAHKSEIAGLAPILEKEMKIAKYTSRVVS